MTSDTTVVPLRQPDEVDDPLTAVLRSGARRLLAQAVEVEAEAFLATMRELRLMREHSLLSPHRARTRPETSHERHIITEAPNLMWATDATVPQQAA
jgi:hypothetical protein